jgi:hypothetical protein
MPNAELSSLAVVSPVLSRLSVGIKGTQNYIADTAIPLIPVDQETVTWPLFTNEHVQDVNIGSDIRALDGDPVEDLLDAINKDSHTLDEHMRAGKIDQRRINAANASQGGAAVRALQARYIRKVKNRVLIVKEKTVASALMTSTNYGANTVAGGDWSASATKVRDLFFAKREKIQKATGYDINRFVLGRKVRRALLQCPDIYAGRQYVKGGYLSDEDLATFFELQPGQLITGTAVTQTKALPGKAGTPTSIWAEDSAAMYYVDDSPKEEASDLNASFAYTMQLTYPETGTPEKVMTWLDGLFTRFVYGQTYGTKVTFGGDNGAGFLFTGITGAIASS